MSSLLHTRQQMLIFVLSVADKKQKWCVFVLVPLVLKLLSEPFAHRGICQVLSDRSELWGVFMLKTSGSTSPSFHFLCSAEEQLARTVRKYSKTSKECGINLAIAQFFVHGGDWKHRQLSSLWKLGGSAPWLLHCLSEMVGAGLYVTRGSPWLTAEMPDLPPPSSAESKPPLCQLSLCRCLFARGVCCSGRESLPQFVFTIKCPCEKRKKKKVSQPRHQEQISYVSLSIVALRTQLEHQEKLKPVRIASRESSNCAAWPQSWQYVHIRHAGCEQTCTFWLWRLWCSQTLYHDTDRKKDLLLKVYMAHAPSKKKSDL